MSNPVNIATTSLNEFERVYQVFDANGDGILTRAEIMDALEVLGQGISLRDQQNLLALINPEAIVTRTQFIDWMSSRQDLDLIADLREVFNLIDVDRSGQLSFDEFTQIAQHQIPVITTDEVRALGVETAAQRCLDYLRYYFNAKYYRDLGLESQPQSKSPG